MDKLDFLRDNRTKQQYLDDISKTQEIEDNIIFKFSILQGISCESNSPRETLKDLDKVIVSSDYTCENFGLIEVKFHYDWQEELGFKKYQLVKYNAKNCSILLINDWKNKPMFATFNNNLLSPAWILEFGIKPSDKLSSKANGKFDIAVWAKNFIWEKLI